MEFDVVLERDESGAIVADVPLLPGCHTSGRTKQEALANVREAIRAYLDVMGPPTSTVIAIERVNVET